MTTTTSQTDLGAQGNPPATPPGGRVQLALNVRDVDAAVEFYTKLFGVGPAKRRPGYANFAVASPPLKLVLIEDRQARGDGVAGALNHLGVEVTSSDEVSSATEWLTGRGLSTLTQDAAACCFAVQDKVWVHDPDGAPWEVYTVLADAPEATVSGSSACSTVEGRCVPADDDAWDGTGRDELALNLHGVPVAPAGTARAAAGDDAAGDDDASGDDAAAGEASGCCGATAAGCVGCGCS
jgi:catechol 2,3-dioxygenase-like lactoylglutathione lyase family enzyme